MNKVIRVEDIQLTCIAVKKRVGHVELTNGCQVVKCMHLIKYMCNVLCRVIRVAHIYAYLENV